MLRSLLAPLRNLQDHVYETSFDDAAQSSTPVTPQGSGVASQVKSLVEELKLAEDTYSRITVTRRIIIELS